MAKNKTKKKGKSNNNKKGGSSKGGGSGTTANVNKNIDNVVATNNCNKNACKQSKKSSDRSSSSSSWFNLVVWSTADECSYYAALGCHIANLHQLYCGTQQTNSNNSNKSIASTKLSKSRQQHDSSCPGYEYEQMYQLAQRQYPWILGIEQFDPSEYHPEDIQYIPEVALNDGDDCTDDDYDDYDDGDEGGGGDAMTLTCTNVTNRTNICFVTVYDVDVCGADGSILRSGIAASTSSPTAVAAAADTATTNANATTKERKCTTFIVLCPPRTFVHLCSLAPNQKISQSQVPITSWSQVEIENDVQPWSAHLNVNDEHDYLLHFPFCGLKDDTLVEREEDEDDDDDDNAIATDATATADMTYYQCTQSEHGQLTHFFHGNYHAIDFACPVGTSLYSPVNGIVVDVRDKQQQQQHSEDGIKKKSSNSGNDDDDDDDDDSGEEVSGIAAKNLFHWNSIMIQVVDDDDDENETTETSSVDETTNNPLYIEFVHIQTNSCIVQIGDAVQKGQLICKSGSVGFSPEPHLHLAAYRSRGDDAATVRVRFECGGNGGDSSSDDAVVVGDDNGIQPVAVAGDGGTPNGKKALSFLPVAGGWYNKNGIK